MNWELIFGYMLYLAVIIVIVMWLCGCGSSEDYYGPETASTDLSDSVCCTQCDGIGTDMITCYEVCGAGCY